MTEFPEYIQIIFSIIAVIYILVALLFSIFCGVVPLIIILIVILTHQSKEERFVIEHSVTYKEIRKIRQKYTFYPLKNLSFKKNINNRQTYRNTSCYDYLEHLVRTKEIDAEGLLNKRRSNKKNYQKMMDEIKERHFIYGTFDVDSSKLNKTELLKTEKNYVQSLFSKPDEDFKIKIYLRCEWETRRGKHWLSKENVFSSIGLLSVMIVLRQRKEDIDELIDLTNTIIDDSKEEQDDIDSRRRDAEESGWDEEEMDLEEFEEYFED